MSDLCLVEVSDRNRSEVLDIQLFPSQQSNLPSIRSSLDMAERYPDAQPYAILLDEKICGFVLYGVDEETGRWKVFRLYIDKAFQSRGIGQRIMVLLLDLLRHEHDATEVLIVYNKDNESAASLYKKLGFSAYEQNGDKVLSKLVFSN